MWHQKKYNTHEYVTDEYLNDAEREREREREEKEINIIEQPATSQRPHVHWRILSTAAWMLDYVLDPTRDMEKRLMSLVFDLSCVSRDLAMSRSPTKYERGL
jgi:hypothetical protein